MRKPPNTVKNTSRKAMTLAEFEEQERMRQDTDRKQTMEPDIRELDTRKFLQTDIKKYLHTDAREMDISDQGAFREKKKVL